MTDWFRQDLRLALRQLVRRPGLSLVIVMTLAVGLGVNTVAFSAMNALLFKQARRPGADQNGWLFIGTPQNRLAGSSLPVFEALERSAGTLGAVAAEGRIPLALRRSGAGPADAVIDEAWALIVSPSYFSIVPVTPLAGRVLGPADARADGVAVVVSERFWRERLGATDDNLAAAAFLLNDQPATVVGILPDGFQGPGGLFEPDLWVPLASRRALGLPATYESPDADWLTLFARPADDVTREAVQNEAALVAADARASDPDGLRVSFEWFADGHPEVRSMAPFATAALGIVGVVLLIACFNVAGLMLARSLERRRDLSVSSALGASRWRLVRQLLTDGAVFATLATAAALLLAAWTAQLLAAFSLPAPIPQRLHFAMDLRLFGFAGLLALVATIVPALAPAWQILHSDLARWVRVAGTTDGSGVGQRRTRRAFVLAQIAGSTVFLVLALTFGMTFLGAWRTDPGFDTEHTALLTLDAPYYGYTAADARVLWTDLVERVAADPGVNTVAVADRVPFFVGYERTVRASLDGRECEASACIPLGSYAVSPGYFDALGVPLQAGRPFDATNPEAVVLSAAAADALWPGENAIGRRIRTWPDGTWRVVTGVAADITHRTFGETVRPHLFRPFVDDDYTRPVTLVARAVGDPARLPGRFRSLLRELDPDLPAQTAMTMTERLALPLWMPRTTAGFFGISGLLALLLSTVGLFGGTAFAINQRRREFGLRIALGAEPATVQRQVVRETLRLGLPGVVLGAAIAVGLGYFAASRIVGVAAAGPVALAGAVLLQLLVTASAGWLPARRAGSADPLEVLRAE